MPNCIEPTEDERKNGWTAESLTEYVNERREHQAIRAGVIDIPDEMRRQYAQNPSKANSQYDPYRW